MTIRISTDVSSGVILAMVCEKKKKHGDNDFPQKKLKISSVPERNPRNITDIL